MSYILEALRRAESERERGAVPGLNAQPLGPADGGQAVGGGWPSHWTPWAIAAVAVLVAGASGWAWYSATGEQRPTPAAAPPPAAVDGAVATAPPVTAPAALPTLPVLPPTTATQPTVRSTQPIPAPAPAATPPPAAATVRADAAATPARPPAPTPSPVASAAEPRIYTMADLPDATRRELPSLSVAGASYSEHASNRLLIVNGNVFHEGDRLAADLVLERIDLKSAVLQFKGVRFMITY